MQVRLLFLLGLFQYAFLSSAQNSGFGFGKILLSELDMITYQPDTVADAVILNEFGESFITGDNTLLLEYHVKIKILKRSGFKKADFSIPLYKKGQNFEKWISLEASTFNREGNAIKESKFDRKAFFIDKSSENYEVVKFTLPDIRVGSVIEVQYKTESPFLFNFYPWKFQDDCPKIHSEYWATIPGNYIYNIALKGFLKLSKNESEIVSNCFRINGRTADCVLSKYAMENIPAFVEEDYMTAKQNFLSSINYELSEVKMFDGRVNRITREWKDVEEELRLDERFGKQIRKARSLADEQLKSLVAAESDTLKKANIIYDHVRRWYTWNGELGKYSYTDVKKAYDLRKGNVGDINLTLIGLMQEFDLNVSPVILSTRENGLVVELYPVLSGYNYVIAALTSGSKDYLLDASEPFLPFGMLPMRCVNGKGRLISKNASYWVELNPVEKKKRVVSFNLKLMEDGVLKGKLRVQSYGYEAMDVRTTIASKADQNEYIKWLEKQFPNAEISNYSIVNYNDDLKKNVAEDMDIAIAAFDNPQASVLYFSPFIVGRFQKNPLKSPERLYPVDLGVPEETTFILTLELPQSIVVDEAPATVAFQLPQGGGRFLLNVASVGNKISVTNSVAFSKPVYTSTEYHYLREFFDRIVHTQQGQFVLKKK